ncbi:hypothetical protein Mapa_005224 [Marchantia paleacea]|nr:hypothetical protein Mapa_005224 [Marchantia paleacea]
MKGMPFYAHGNSCHLMPDSSTIPPSENPEKNGTSEQANRTNRIPVTQMKAAMDETISTAADRAPLTRATLAALGSVESGVA